MMKRTGFPAMTILALAVAHGTPALASDSSKLEEAIERFNRHEFSESRQQLERLLAAEATNGDARLYLGRIALEEQRFAEGLEQLEHATRLSPTNAVYFLWLARGYGLQAKKAGIPTGVGSALRSKAAFEKAVALDPGLTEAREDLIQFHREAPGIVGGSRKIARGHAAEIKKRDPYMGSLVHGDLLLDEKKYREAENLYRAAAESRPEKSDAYYRLGKLYLKTKEWDRAYSAFEKTSPTNSNEAEAFFYIGETGALSGLRLTRAEEALKKYLSSKPWSFLPSLAEAHFRLGQIYERKAEHERARTEFQAALKLDPDYKEAKAALRKLK